MAKTRSALGRAHLPPTTVFRRLKTTRRCFDGCPVPVRGIFPDVIKFHVAVHTLWEKVIRFPHPDYNPDRAQKLISSSCPYTSVDTQHFIQIDARVFLVILHTDRQTDRKTNAGARAKTYTSSVVVLNLLPVEIWSGGIIGSTGVGLKQQLPVKCCVNPIVIALVLAFRQFSNMAVVRHIGFIFWIFDHPRSELMVRSRCSDFVSIECFAAISLICQFGLKMTNHAPYLGLWSQNLGWSQKVRRRVVWATICGGLFAGSSWAPCTRKKTTRKGKSHKSLA